VKTDYSQYDEPMTVSSNIIKECQKLQITCDFPPLKLKPGSGEQVLLVLNGLAGKAMKKKNFSFKKPIYEKPN
jgi:estrogen-related receptor beta like 1